MWTLDESEEGGAMCGSGVKAVVAEIRPLEGKW